MSASPSVPRTLGRAVVVGCAALGVASLMTVLIASPGGTPVSSDPGAPTVPTWVTVLPAVVGIAAALLLPRRAPALPVTTLRRDRLATTTSLLLGCAVAFPLAVGLLGWTGETYPLAKLALLVVVPAAVVLLWRGAIGVERAPGRWRWWAPAVVVLLWFALSQLAPWNPAAGLDEVATQTLVVAAVATAITAGVGEELFYRRWLQTRLEAAIGPWPGIALASLAFALMHLGTHGTGEPLLDLARVVVAQGSFGLFVGVVWWRYRNLLAVVVVHLLVNGWAVLVELAGR